MLDGFYMRRKIPCQIDGGLKCFGHPIGASGMRMIYEIYLQIGRAGRAALQDARYASPTTSAASRTRPLLDFRDRPLRGVTARRALPPLCRSIAFGTNEGEGGAPCVSDAHLRHPPRARRAH